jgi:hypothetical protein
VDAESGDVFPGFVSTRLMLSKVTFADDTIDDITRETRFADEEWQAHKSYQGIAIHSWRAYKMLRQRSE